MNTRTDALSEPGTGSRAAGAAVLRPVSPLYWSLRRELWENRSVWMAPLAVSAVFLAGFALSALRLPERMRSAATPGDLRVAIAVPYDLAAGLLMLTGMLVGAFYSLDALYGERRDRSTLFWKSMPVSDRTTVLAKAAVPLVLLPLLASVLTVLLHLVMLVLQTAVVAGSGHGVGALWSEVSIGRRSEMMLYHMVTVHSLSHAPFYAWMLLVSAWAPRAPLLWAVLPPVALGALEKLVLDTTHLAAFAMDRLAGGPNAMAMAGTMPTNPMTHLTPGAFLASPGLWLGLAVTAAFLGGAVRLRRSRGPL